MSGALRLRFGIVASAACLALLVTGGCNATNDDTMSGAAAPNAGDEHGDDAVGDDAGAPPNDDPALGADTVEPDDGDADAGAPADGSDSGPAKTSGGSCSPGGLYCGGDKVVGNPKTLYKCNGPGTPTVIETCASGCTVNSGSDDACTPAPGSKVAAPVPGKVVTYPFGVKNSSYAAGYHTGDDYATPTGSKAIAVRSGTIRWSNDNGGAYGKWMGLDADNGRTYVYCHLSSRLVASGTKVVAGQQLAKTGATGNVTGPHLHFEDHPLGPFVYGQVRKPSW